MRHAETVLVVCGLALMSGCRTAVRVADVPRVDLKLEGGNRGYLIGTPPEAAGLKPTRKMVSTDIEIPTWYKPKRTGAPADLEAMAPEVDQAGPQGGIVVQGPQSYDIYTVQKGESLWTIAAKPEIYGKATRWRQIFDANRDLLKNPDSVRPGMRLKIPRDGGPGSGDDGGTLYRK